MLGDGQSDTDGSNAGRVRKEVDDWLTEKFDDMKVSRFWLDLHLGGSQSCVPANDHHRLRWFQ